MSYRLLEQFESTFLNGPYLHRNSTLGDAIAYCLFEDLYNLGRSKILVDRIDLGLSVLNIENKRTGVIARRGDGSFGELVPGADSYAVENFTVRRGPIATIEIGAEVKILAKAMIKQIDRVISDLTGQVVHFQSKRGDPVTVGIVGINRAPKYLSFEGKNQFPTDGKKYKHPVQEAASAEARLVAKAGPHFDEFLILQFEASNISTVDPKTGKPVFDFAWVDPKVTSLNYGAVLARVSQRFETNHRR